MAPVDSNQLGTEKWIPWNMVGIVPTITLICGLLAPCMGARDIRLLIFKHLTIIINDHQRVSWSVPRPIQESARQWRVPPVA